MSKNMFFTKSKFFEFLFLFEAALDYGPHPVAENIIF